jgi:hypothetical protein
MLSRWRLYAEPLATALAGMIYVLWAVTAGTVFAIKVIRGLLVGCLWYGFVGCCVAGVIAWALGF